MKATQRLWRTGDGRLVPDNDPAAATLAYAPGDEVTAHDESLVPDQGDSGEAKAAAKPADKAVEKPEDKGGARRGR